MGRKKASDRPAIPADLIALPWFTDLWNARIAALPPARRPTPLGEELQLREALKLLKSHGSAVLRDGIEQAINCAWTGFRVDWLRLPPPTARRAGGAAYKTIDVDKL